jgi:hypothetical protein
VVRAVQGDDIDARNTFYCPCCQPGPHPPSWPDSARGRDRMR